MAREQWWFRHRLSSTAGLSRNTYWPGARIFQALVDTMSSFELDPTAEGLSRELHALAFDACVMATARTAAYNPERGDLLEAVQHSRLRAKMRERSRDRSDLAMAVLGAPLLFLCFASPASFSVKLTAATTATVFLFPWLRHWAGRLWITRIVLPFLYCHFVAHSTSILVYLVASLPILLANFLGLRPPWYASVAIYCGVLFRLVSLFLFESGSPWQFPLQVLGVALLSPGLLAIIFDGPKIIGPFVDRVLARFTPLLLHWQVGAIRAWNRRSGPLGPIWAVHAGSLLWIAGAPPSDRYLKHTDERDRLWDERDKTWVFVLVTSFVAGLFVYTASRLSFCWD